jgi:RNA recognition motif-containing protein
MNIFVAGLSYQITDADLKELFEEYGEVSSAKIITDRETRRSKGYGFVEMSNENEGQHERCRIRRTYTLRFCSSSSR